VLSGRGLCDELITRPEESYRLCCVVFDLETSRTGAPYIYDISHLRVKEHLLYSLQIFKHTSYTDSERETNLDGPVYNRSLWWLSYSFLIVLHLILLI